MFDVLADAAPEHASGRDAQQYKLRIEQAVQRTEESFANSPNLYGETLMQLAVLLRVSNHAPQAVLVMRNAISKLTTGSDNFALQRARAQLGLTLVTMPPYGFSVEAESLANSALVACQSDGCERVKAYAEHTLSVIAETKGQRADAINSASSAAIWTERAFGTSNPEAALAWARVAVLQRNAGRISEALRSIQRAEAIRDRAPLRPTDARSFAMKAAMVAASAGQYEKSQQAFDLLLQSSQGQTERIQLLRYSAQGHNTHGMFDQALLQIAESERLLVAKPNEWESAYLATAKGEACMNLHRFSDAREALHDSDTRLERLGLPLSHMDRLRIQRLLLETRVRETWGHSDELTENAARALVAKHKSVGGETNAPLEFAYTRDLFGMILQARDHSTYALIEHKAAKRLLSDLLPASHPR